MAFQPDLEKLYPSLERFTGRTKALFEGFHQSQNATRLTKAVVRVAVAGINLEELRQDIVGRYFEEVAGLYVRSKLEQDKRFVLGPSETGWLYQQLNPGAHRYYTYNLTQNIFGITVPDGLILQRGQRYLQLAGVCEYTLENNVGKSRRKQAQLERYQDPENIARGLGMYEFDREVNSSVYGQRLRMLLSKIRPDIPSLPISLASNWEIIYAVPAKSGQTDQVNDLPYVPCDRKQFASYIERLIEQVMSEYQPGVDQLGEDRFGQLY